MWIFNFSALPKNTIFLNFNSNPGNLIRSIQKFLRYKFTCSWRLFGRKIVLNLRFKLNMQNSTIIYVHALQKYFFILYLFLFKKKALLLKELVRHYPAPAQQDMRACSPSVMLQSALTCMLDLLAQINTDMEQLHILGYPGDLRLLVRKDITIPIT